jgi:NAD dependent epimerase/dehydratase family enzyme
VHRPAIFRAPAFALRTVLRGFSRELLDSRRVLPQRALEHEFPFRFSELEPAIKDLLG